MRSLFATLTIALSLLVVSPAAAAADPTCNLPVQPHWCAP